MALLLGITITGYHKIEKGRTSMSLERLNQIAEVLDEKPLSLMQFKPAALYEHSLTLGI